MVDVAQPSPDANRDLALQVEYERLRLEHERLLAQIQLAGQRPERRIIYFQMALGASLILTGALLVAVFTYTESIATTIIGAGAALLPSGAAAAASARIKQTTPAAATEVAQPEGTQRQPRLQP